MGHVSLENRLWVPTLPYHRDMSDVRIYKTCNCWLEGWTRLSSSGWALKVEHIITSTLRLNNSGRAIQEKHSISSAPSRASNDRASDCQALDGQVFDDWAPKDWGWAPNLSTPSRVLWIEHSRLCISSQAFRIELFRLKKSRLSSWYYKKIKFLW